MTDETKKTESGVRMTAVAPQFVVRDVVATAEYYRDVLGFRILGFFGEPTVFAMVVRDVAEIHFGKADDGAAVASNRDRRKISSDAYIWVNDVNALHAELKRRGAKIAGEPVMRPYKCYELEVDDLNGFRLVFSQDFSQA